MEVKIFKEADRETWDQFVNQTPGSPVLQSFAWGALKEQMGWHPWRVGGLVRGKLVVGASFLQKKLPLGQSLFYAPRGPCFAQGANISDVLPRFMEHVKQLAREQRAHVIKIDPEIPETDMAFVAPYRALGFTRASSEIQPRATFLLNLQPSLEVLFKQFEEKTRYNIRLAARKGVVVRESSDAEGVATFCRLQATTSQRNQFLVHPDFYYQEVWKQLGMRGMAKIFTAYLDEKAIASVFLFLFGDRVWYMYGASANEHRNVMPNHALHWEVIQWAKVAGYTTYDLWGIPVHPEPSHPLWGVYRFKKGFRGEQATWMGMHDLPVDRWKYYLVDYGIKSYQMIRNLMKKGKLSGSLRE